MTGATREPGGPFSSWYRDDRPEEIHVTIARWLLATFMAIAGIGHFTAVDAFTAQVPPWMPWPTAVIYISGVIELSFAIGLVATRKHRALVGWLLAGFYVVIFPGNISQFITGQDAFGLDSDLARGVRLLFQPVLIVWALWCTGAWREFRQKRKATDS